MDCYYVMVYSFGLIVGLASLPTWRFLMWSDGEMMTFGLTKHQKGYIRNCVMTVSHTIGISIM
jgi:uncharacterized membrane protein